MIARDVTKYLRKNLASLNDLATTTESNVLLKDDSKISSVDEKLGWLKVLNKPKFSLQDNFSSKYLTNGELMSIFYFSEDKSIAEIANILQLTECEIEVNISNAKDKLECASKIKILDFIQKSDLHFL